MKIRYEITHVDNAKDLPDYLPVTGQWSAYPDELPCSDSDWLWSRPAGTAVVETVYYWFSHDFPISVRLYHADGREITGDMPWDGAFVATRE